MFIYPRNQTFKIKGEHRQEHKDKLHQAYQKRIHIPKYQLLPFSDKAINILF